MAWLRLCHAVWLLRLAMIAGFAVAPGTAVYVAIFYFLLQQVQNAITVPLVEAIRRMTLEPARRVTVDPPLARCGAWYEMFPRSCTTDAARSGTFRDAEARLPALQAKYEAEVAAWEEKQKEEAAKVSEVGWEAANQAFQTLGGMAYSKEYPVERIFRDARIAKNIPVAEELVLAHIGTQMLGLPKSY